MPIRKPVSRYLLISFGALLFCANALAESPEAKAAEAAPLTYNMQLIYIFEGDNPEFILTIGQSGFRSVERLKEFIAGLPKGSTLEFQSTCRRTGGEPIISSEEEVAEFRKFCESHGIIFKYLPSG